MLTVIRERWRLLAGALLLILAAGSYWATSAYRNVSNVLQQAGKDVESSGRILFESVALDRRPPSGMEWIGGSASGYTDATLFHDHLFVLNSSELVEYDANGARVARFRSGFELPASSLVSLQVAASFESKQPELFLATSGAGYLAYDGATWRHVRMQGSKLLSMHVLANGRVLLGSERAGLLAHDARGMAPLHDLLKTKKVTFVAGENESDLWIGTLDEGLFRFAAGQLQSIAPVPDKRILWIEVDGPRVWAATPVGVAEFENGQFKRELASGFFVRTLHKRAQTLVAGTLEDGLLEIPLEVRSPKPVRATEVTNREIRKVFAAGGREFVLTPDRLLTGDKEVLHAEGATLADGNIAALAPDDAGRLWIGYFDRGLDVLDTVANRARHIEDDTVFCVNRIVHDMARQRSIIATGNGVAFLDGNATVRRVMHKEDGLIANHATDLLVRPSGALTVATPAGVTFVEDNGQTSSIYAFHGLVNNHVYALGSCRERLLAGTLGGLTTLEGGLVRASFTTANSGLRHNWITAIADAGNTCMVGTYGAGVMAFEPDESWRAFPDLPSRGFEVNPNAMAASTRGVYAGSLGRGLAIFSLTTGRWNWLTDGLPSLNVTAVAVRNGVVYIGTDNGLVKAEESGLVRE
jgi:ligand-binding sensor domain-containing protein